MQLKKFIRKTHKWLGLIIGIQVVFWVFGGLVMSSFPIEQVHGDHLLKETTPIVLDVDRLYPLVNVIKQNNLKITKVTTVTGFYGPLYRFTDLSGKLHFFDAMTGLAIKAIKEEQAILIAQSIYSGQGNLLSSSRVTSNSTEYRKRIPAWRIEFDDNEAATFYIAEDSGELMSVRNSMWRIFDFVWMLHIMDYKDRDNFNTWLLISAAAFALFVSLSGMYLVVKTFRRKDFGFDKKH